MWILNRVLLGAQITHIIMTVVRVANNLFNGLFRLQKPHFGQNVLSDFRFL